MTKDTGKVRRLRKLRESRGHSLRSLADELDLNYSAISYWENGVKFPRAANRVKLEEFFGEDIKTIMSVETSAS